MAEDFPVGGTEVQPAPESPPSGDIGAASAPGQFISVGSGDEQVARIQLAARWAEAYAPAGGDSLEAALHRFQRAFSYIDSVIHDVEPDAL